MRYHALFISSCCAPPQLRDVMVGVNESTAWETQMFPRVPCSFASDHESIHNPLSRVCFKPGQPCAWSATKLTCCKRTASFAGNSALLEGHRLWVAAYNWGIALENICSSTTHNSNCWILWLNNSEWNKICVGVFYAFFHVRFEVVWLGISDGYLQNHPTDSPHTMSPSWGDLYKL